VLGGVLWAIGVTTLGFYLGQVDVVARNLEVTIIVIVLISILPMVIEIWRGRRHRAGQAQVPASTDSTENSPSE
jgi:membrane-associated protein